MSTPQRQTIEDKTPERRSQSVAVTLISPTAIMITDCTLETPHQSLAAYSARSIITPHSTRSIITHRITSVRRSVMIKVYTPTTSTPRHRALTRHPRAMKTGRNGLIYRDRRLRASDADDAHDGLRLRTATIIKKNKSGTTSASSPH